MTRTVFRRPTQKDYFSSKRTWMQDNRLSLKATGLIAKMLSMPEEWEFHQSHLVTVMPDGKESLRSAFKEAAKYGYLIKHAQIRNDDGTFGDMVYEIWDSPQFDKPMPDELVESLFSQKPNWKEIKKFLPNAGFPEPDEAESEKSPLEQSNKETKDQQQHDVDVEGLRKDSESSEKKSNQKENEFNSSRERSSFSELIPRRESKSIEIISYDTAYEWLLAFGFSRKVSQNLLIENDWKEISQTREILCKSRGQKDNIHGYFIRTLENLNQSQEY